MINILKKNKFVYLTFCTCTLAMCIFSGAEGMGLRTGANDEIIFVRHKPDAGTGYLVIEGSFGTVNPTKVDITNPQISHSFNPVLAICKSISSIRAVAVWKSYDLSSEIYSIQLTFASASGWSSGNITTFSDSNAIPADDYTVEISNDGQVICVILTTYLINEDKIKLLILKSVDGGVNWVESYPEDI